MKQNLKTSMKRTFATIFSFVLTLSVLVGQNLLQVSPMKSLNSVQSTAVVRYEKDAAIMITLNEIDIPRTIEVLDKDQKLIVESDVKKNKFILKNLSYNQLYYLKVKDEKLEDVITVPLTVSPEFKSDNKISPEMLTVVNEFSIQKKRDVTDFLLNDKRIPNFEAVSFLQEFTEDNILPNSSGNGKVCIQWDIWKTMIFWIKRLTKSCNCKVFMSEYTRPIGSPELDASGQINSGDVSVTLGSLSGGSHFTEATLEKGPAKFHHIATEGKHAGGNNDKHTYSNYSEGNNSSHLAFMGYNYFCLNGFGFPAEDCNCSTDLTIKYQYDVMIDVMAETYSSWYGVGSKSARALAEDMVFIFEREDYTTNITPIDAGMVSISQECEIELHPEWFLDYIALLGVAGEAILLTQGDIDLSDLSGLSGIIDSWVEHVGNLITNNLLTHSGEVLGVQVR